MGLPFASQHILCLRRWPVSSLGAAYTSVWHRNPAGRWTFVQDAPPDRSCTRYFGSSVSRVLHEEIKIEWSGPRNFSVMGIGSYEFHWQVSLTDTIGTRFMNTGGSIIPNALWRNPGVLKLLGAASSLAMKTGHCIPNRARTQRPDISQQAKICLGCRRQQGGRSRRRFGGDRPVAGSGPSQRYLDSSGRQIFRRERFSGGF